jgi:hypothetical protein
LIYAGSSRREMSAAGVEGAYGPLLLLRESAARRRVGEEDVGEDEDERMLTVTGGNSKSPLTQEGSSLYSEWSVFVIKKRTRGGCGQQKSWSWPWSCIWRTNEGRHTTQYEAEHRVARTTRSVRSRNAALRFLCPPCARLEHGLWAGELETKTRGGEDEEREEVIRPSQHGKLGDANT